MGIYQVSSREQNEDRQVLAINELRILPMNVFMDKQSGNDFERPAYESLIKVLKSSYAKI